MSELDGRARSVADEIARYLDRRPDASDTEEGVMRWWIPRIRLEEELAVVRNALALLVAQGIVERVVLPSGLVMFRRWVPSEGARRLRGDGPEPAHRIDTESTAGEDTPPCL